MIIIIIIITITIIIIMMIIRPGSCVGESSQSRDSAASPIARTGSSPQRRGAWASPIIELIVKHFILWYIISYHNVVYYMIL